jgi:hypothetical protein
MPYCSFPLLPLGLVVAGAALAQISPAAPMGMTLQQYLTVSRGRLLDRDSDGDGRISAAEFAAGMGGRRGKGKPQGDAAPPAAGATADVPAAPGGMMASRIFDRFDTNHDGYLDKTEVDALLTRRFERMDTNHDGILTAEEREASRGAMRGRAGADD